MNLYLGELRLELPQKIDLHHTKIDFVDFLGDYFIFSNPVVPKMGSTAPWGQWKDLEGQQGRKGW
jgi:hypothetical protein